MPDLLRGRWRISLLLALVIAGCGDTATTIAPTAPPATVASGQAVIAPTSAATNLPPAPATVAPIAAPTTVPAASPTTAPAAADTFTNPILRTNFPDPGVTQVGDSYYAYATNGSGKNIQVARSEDLVKWEVLRDAMPALPKWAQLGGSYVWAPEMIQIDDTFVLYYTARDKAADKQCIGVATADKPEGKFKDTRTEALVCQSDEGGSIDPSPFRDGDKLYLYWKNDGNCCSKATYIYVQELAPDGLSLVGEPTRLLRNDATWEGTLIEAPTMIKQADDYYMFFSANFYAGQQYAVGYATCESAVGPCQDAPENPILASQMTQNPPVVGPGHQTVVQLGDQTWMLYHVWEVSGGRRGNNRYMWMDRIEWQDGKPDVLGPTTAAQPRPVSTP